MSFQKAKFSLLAAAIALTSFAAALPAYAQAQCSKKMGYVPSPQRKIGHREKNNPIEHIVVLIQENHSFDNYFGKLNQKKYYGSEVDGISASHSNPDLNGSMVSAFHETTLCADDPEHGWDAIHQEWNHGKMDGFVKINGKKAMGYYDDSDLPFYYALANRFSIADRYFCSSLTQTYPNRFYFYAGTSFGQVANIDPVAPDDYSQKTIFDVLNKNAISWKYYKSAQGYLELFKKLNRENSEKMTSVESFKADLQNGQLPAVVLIDATFDTEDEHPASNIQVGQKFVADRVRELVQSPYWKTSAMILTYDEGGGFFDHVAPPEACEPDDIQPILEPKQSRSRFNRLGVRVPFVLISPWAKKHFVSHKIYDHTSILRFIEDTYNLPALTNRDANANSFGDLLDFKHPHLNAELNFDSARVAPQCN